MKALITRRVGSAFALILLAGGLLQALPRTPAGPRAACYMATGDGVVMVRDVWSRRLSLPGGELDPTQPVPLALAALTASTTGLQVQVGERLAGDAALTLFACVPRQPLRRQGDALDLPPAIRKQTQQLKVVDPATLPPGRWRNQLEAGRLQGMCREAQAAWSQRPADVAWVDEPPAAPAWFFRELGINRLLQQHLGGRGDGLMRLASGLAEARHIFWLAVLVVALGGWQLGSEFICMVLLASMFNCLIKDLCMLPRPCYLAPALQLEHAANFGFPSGHTVLAGTAFGLLARRSRLPGRWLVALSLVALCGTARIYLGAHFLHDVLGALLLAFGWVAWQGRLAARQPDGRIDFASWSRLGALTIAASLGLALSPPSLVFAAAFSGVLLGQWLFAPPLQSGPTWRQPGGLRRAAWVAVLGLGSLALLEALAHRLRPAQGGSLACALVLALQYGSFGLLLPGLARLHRGARCPLPTAPALL